MVLKAPKVPPQAQPCQHGCLFDLSTDLSEHKNIINETGMASVVAKLKARLAQAASEGGPWAFPFNKSSTDQLEVDICKEQVRDSADRLPAN